MMTKIDVSKEIKYSTSRSGGSGGQNVNKVETAVEGRWHIINSILVTNEQKEILVSKLATRLIDNTILAVRSQESRTQLGNKTIVQKRINSLIAKSLKVDKQRLETKVPKSLVEKRKADKKRNSEKKLNRKKYENE